MTYYYPPEKDGLPEHAISRGTGSIQITHNLAGVFLTSTKLGNFLSPELAIQIGFDLVRTAQRCMENRRGLY